MTDGGLIELTASEAAEQIASGGLSAETYTAACLERIAAIDGSVKAFVQLDREYALAQARSLDEGRRDGRPIGPLHGIPVAIKDIFDTADYPTECGSPLLRGRRPVRDCAAVARLRAAGAVIIGKTVTTEFAYFHPGPTRNPHDPGRTPGGSSSGSAAAVAARMVPLAIGSQTNGSVIRPASFCGVYGVKPTHGTISRHGALILSHALDHVGTFARSLADSALILQTLAGYDPADRDSRPLGSLDFRERAKEEAPAPPHFAFIRTPVWEKADADTRSAFEAMVARLGAAASPIDLGATYTSAWDDHRTIMAADMAHNLGPIVARNPDGASKAFRDLMSEGATIPAVRYLFAREAAARYAAGFDEVFKICDAIITPAAPGVAPKGDATGSPAFCSLWSLTGLPAVTLPLLKGESGLPIGVQVVGARGDDARLLRSANWLVDHLGGT